MALTIFEFALNLASGDRKRAERLLAEPWPGGGGAGLPDWITVDSTPGSESLSLDSAAAPGDFAPIFSLTADGNDVLKVDSAGDAEVFTSTGNGGGFFLRAMDTGATPFRADANNFTVRGNDGIGSEKLIEAILDTGAEALGFFGATPVAKPTGVAVNAAGIHAALVSLGLIAA